ncbi:glutathione S-transferase N-terminal domain-containing protein [Ottowia flava]
MSDTLTFYTNPMSRARVARWMLEETGLPYETQVLEYGTTMKAPGFLAINPMGKVPALKHGDTVVTENAAICMYLADLVPEKKLAPPVGSHARGPYYRWISFMGPLEQLMVAKTTGGALPEPGMAGWLRHRSGSGQCTGRRRERPRPPGRRHLHRRRPAGVVLHRLVSAVQAAGAAPGLHPLCRTAPQPPRGPARERAGRADPGKAGLIDAGLAPWRVGDAR